MDAVAENVVTRLVARIGMVLVTLVLLPLATWVGHRVIANVDAMGQELEVLTASQAVAAEQYRQLAATLAGESGQIYLRSEATKAWDWQKVRDSEQDADRARVEKQLGGRIDSDEARILRLEGAKR